MEKTLFVVSDFTNVCKFVACRGIDEFAKMYESIGLYGKYYAEEKYNIACSNFSNWWCNLDLSIQENIIKYVKSFYESK